MSNTTIFIVCVLAYLLVLVGLVHNEKVTSWLIWVTGGPAPSRRVEATTELDNHAAVPANIEVTPDWIKEKKVIVFKEDPLKLLDDVRQISEEMDRQATVPADYNTLH